MPESPAIDHQARAQIDRLRDGQDQLARDQAKLTVLIDALREQVRRDGEAQAKAHEELFRRLNATETNAAVSRSRWALVGAGVLVLCSSVTSLLVFVAGKLWP